MTPVTEFREPVRFLLGDHEEPPLYLDTAIDRGVRFVVKGGLIEGQTLSPDLSQIQPGLTDPNQYLLLGYEVAQRFLAAQPDRQSFRTRALSRSVGGMASPLFAVEEAIYKLRHGAMFDGWGSFGTWLIGVGGLPGEALWAHLSRLYLRQPVDTVTVGEDGVTLA